jgi:hypothetical protein
VVCLFFWQSRGDTCRYRPYDTVFCIPQAIFTRQTHDSANKSANRSATKKSLVKEKSIDGGGCFPPFIGRIMHKVMVRLCPPYE